jgi:thiol-disulfide isomerase/thioredoxin
MRGWLLGAVALATACIANAERPTLATLSGEVTVVSFWATWCAPCKHELPMVEALYQKLKSDPRVRVVVVSVDAPRKASQAQEEAKKLGLTAPLLVDEPEYAKLFGDGDEKVPRLVVIDRKHAGLERIGALAGETADAFVRNVSAAVESVKAGAPRPPSPMWQSFHAPEP